MIEIYTDVSIAKGHGVATCFILTPVNFMGYNTFEYTDINSSLQGELFGIRDGLKYALSVLDTEDVMTVYCDNKAAIALIQAVMENKSITKFKTIVNNIVKMCEGKDIRFVLIQGHQTSHNPNKIVDLISNSVLRLNLKDNESG